MALDLPVFERFKAIFADKLNRIVSELRASTVQPGIGYKVNRTPGGTTLVIDQQPGGGGTAATNYCPFKVTDESTDEVTRIAVQLDQVEGRWPFGMDGESTYYKPIPDEYLQAPGWVAFYLRLKVDETGLIFPEETAISFRFTPDFKQKGDGIQWFYIAGINIDINEETNKPYISRIDNSCPIVYAWQPSTCPFRVEDATDEGSLVLLVKSGKIENAYPYGMAEKTHFYVPIDDTVGTWCAVYSKLTIETKASEITIETNYKTSDETTQWDLLAEVNLDYTESQEKYISFIKNICTQPALGDGVKKCAFSITDDSAYDENGDPQIVRVLINAGKVNDKYPLECPNGIPYEYYPDIQQPWTAVYVRLHVDEYGSFYSNDNDAVRFIFTNDYQSDFGTNYQWFLIGTINISKNERNHDYISDIQNFCPQIFINPVSNCPLELSYGADDGDVVRIQVRSGTIVEQYPDGMAKSVAFYLTVPNTQNWWAVYSAIELRDGQIDQSKAPNRTITLQPQYQTSTETRQWDLLGELTTFQDENFKRTVDWMISYCYVPKIAPLSDVKCWFKVTNVTSSEDEFAKVRVAPAMVAGRWPNGMGLDYPDYILELTESSYIYMVLQFDTAYMVLLEADTAIEINNYTDLKQSTSDTTFTLIATVAVSGKNVTINNMCYEIIPNPCLLDFSTEPETP